MGTGNSRRKEDWWQHHGMACSSTLYVWIWAQIRTDRKTQIEKVYIWRNCLSAQSYFKSSYECFVMTNNSMQHTPFRSYVNNTCFKFIRPDILIVLKHSWFAMLCLIWAVQQSDSSCTCKYILFFIFFHLWFYHRILNMAPGHSEPLLFMHTLYISFASSQIFREHESSIT